MKLRYMIIGAGGVGGPVGAYLSKSGADGLKHDLGRRRHLIDAHADGTRHGVENRRCDGHGRNLGNAFCAERTLRFRVLD